MSNAKSLPRIHVLGMGGTIAMSRSVDHAGVVPALSAQALLDALPELQSVARVSATSFRQMPGAHLGFEDIEALAKEVERLVSGGVDGVVILQGTDTIEETAFALDRLLDLQAAVVMTGAMRNSTLAGADGPANLLAAVRVAASRECAGRGCLVVFNDEIHAARFVRKTHTTLVSAFKSPACGPIGWIAESTVRLVVELPALPRIERAVDPAATSVGLVALGFDDDGRLVRRAAGEYQALVVACVGGGHCSPAAAGHIAEAASRMPVVLASRVGAGPLLQGTYGFVGSEIQLLSSGAIAAGWLDAPKARVLTSLLLRHRASEARLREVFRAFD